MAEEHPLALSLAAEGKRSPGTMAASAKRKAAPEIEIARRRTMSGHFAEHASLLPGLSARAMKTRIVEETVTYAEALRAKAAELEAQSAAAAGQRRAATAWTIDGDGPGVLVSVDASCFVVRLPAARRPGSLTRVLEVFERHGVAVLVATVTSNGGEAAVTVTTSAVEPGVVRRIKADISSSIE